MRPKWDEYHGEQTYGDITIDKALAKVTGQYKPKRHKKRKARNKTSSRPQSSQDLPPLYRPDEVAKEFVETNNRIIYWRSVFHIYTGTYYQPVTEAELGARLVKFITDVEWWARPAKKERNGDYEEGAVKHPDYNDLMVVVEKIVPKTTHIREIILQLKTDHLVDTIDAPVWTGESSRPEPTEIMAFGNGLLHIPSGVIHDHSDELFSLNAVKYDYNSDAHPPEQWLAFLNEIFGEDEECIGTLQELFGYFLLPNTNQQKIALIVGPKRSGKGTIARVLTGMIGQANVAGPTLGSLGTNFGLWPLLHKQLAIIADARLSGRTDQAAVTERLLSISGEDTITVDRKHLPPWTGKLPIRFLIMTNELPKLTDASGALAGRFVLLTMTRSFYGHEDHGLTARLLGELPGILNWAIEGWHSLNERGFFAQPKSSEMAMQELEDLASPVSAFVRERCIVTPNAKVGVDVLFNEWLEYCQDSGRTHPGTKQSFGRDLKAVIPTLGRIQPRCDGTRIRIYTGIKLNLNSQDNDQENLGLSGTQVERDGTQVERDGTRLERDGRFL